MRIVVFIMVLILHLQADVESFKREILAIQPSIRGWCSLEKATHFIDLVLEVKPEVCVEIGVLSGSSVFPVASALKYLDHGTLIAIDPWDRQECVKYFDPVKDVEHLRWWNAVNLHQCYYEFLELLRENDLEKYCCVLKMSAEKAAPIIGSIDVLYIDGNFSEEGTLKNVQMYLPKVRSGGYIWINDTLAECKQSAVALLFDECNLLKTISEFNGFLFQKR